MDKFHGLLDRFKQLRLAMSSEVESRAITYVLHSPLRKRREDSFDERAKKSNIKTVVCMSPGQPGSFYT
jgi:hypothetical protein